MRALSIDDAFDFPGGFPRAWAVIQAGNEAGLHIGGQVYVSVQGKPVAHAAFGLAREGFQMKRDSWVLWLSAGKPLPAVALMQTVEEGKIGLDTCVREVIPEFGSHGKEKLTFRHLLTHTAGIRPADQLQPLWSRTCALWL